MTSNHDQPPAGNDDDDIIVLSASSTTNQNLALRSQENGQIGDAGQQNEVLDSTEQSDPTNMQMGRSVNQDQLVGSSLVHNPEYAPSSEDQNEPNLEGSGRQGEDSDDEDDDIEITGFVDRRPSGVPSTEDMTDPPLVFRLPAHVYESPTHSGVPGEDQSAVTSDSSERIAPDSQYSTDRDSAGGSPRRDPEEQIKKLKKKYGVPGQQGAHNVVDVGAQQAEISRRFPIDDSLFAPTDMARQITQSDWNAPAEAVAAAAPAQQRPATVNLSDERPFDPESLSSMEYVKRERPYTVQKTVEVPRPPPIVLSPESLKRKRAAELESARQFARDIGAPTHNLKTDPSGGTSGWASEPVDWSSDQQHSVGTYPRQNAAELIRKIRLHNQNPDDEAGPSSRPPQKPAKKRQFVQDSREEAGEDGDNEESDGETGAEPEQKRPKRGDKQ